MHDYVAELRALVGHRPLILPGAAVLLTDERDHVLLLARADTGGWGLPGGLMERGECLEDTARREVQEETGLELGTLQLFNVYSGADQFYRYPNGDEIYNVTVVYRAHPPAGSTPRVDQRENTDWRMFPADRPPAALIAPEKPILADYARAIAHATGQPAGSSGEPLQGMPPVAGTD
ncbi:NUDIX hydrolase [Streptomyces sp. NPDC059002]|uniref:NUDIX hydrolase n=1 Tax=Streptomyces sp. NPDC059002 TaxID=3346690 RepID=UPI0036BB048E